jgi:putative transposase
MEREDEQGAVPYRVLRVKFRRTARRSAQTDPVRRSMAALWNDMVKVHQRIRRSRGTWPTQAEFDRHFLKHKARYPGLPTGCIQQAVRKFFGNLRTTRANQEAGREARYPWRDRKRYATVPYRGDLVSWEKGVLRLGGGNGGGAIGIPMAEDPGEIVKAELQFDEVLVTVKRPDLVVNPIPEDRPARVAAADPGQRWAWAILTEKGQSFMVNGRGLVSEKIRHAKKMSCLRSQLDQKQRDSRRWRKIKRRIAREKARSRRRVRDMNHKITCGVVRECEQARVTKLVLSQPEGIATAPGRKAQRQRNGVWEYGEQTRQIEYKAQGHFEVICDEERGTSSTCPRCQHRSHPSGRTFRCPACGWTGHRDLVGAGNQLGRHVPHADVAGLIMSTHPRYLRSFATAKDRSSVVETDRSQGGASRASRHRRNKYLREWLVGDHAGRAAPQPLGVGSRKAAARPIVVRGKILESFR